MDRLQQVYNKYATTTDILHNDIAMPNENAHRFFKKMGVKLKPLELARYVKQLDPHEYGYITLKSIHKMIES